MKAKNINVEDEGRSFASPGAAKPAEDVPEVPEVQEVEVEEVDVDKLLAVRYEPFKASISELVSYSQSISIIDDMSLEVAQNSSGRINDLLKVVDKVRTEVKAPYLEITRKIDAHGKNVSSPLLKAKDSINTAITGYKEIQAAKARAELKAKEEALRKIAVLKEEEAERISRINKQLIARLYGGSWNNAEGKIFSSEGCKTPDDCDKLSIVIDKKIPKPDAFEHMQEEYQEVILYTKKLLAAHQVNLIESISEDKFVAAAATRRIEISREAAGLEAQEIVEELKEDIQKETAKEIKQERKEVADMTKGVRSKVVFDVVDKVDVPLQFLEINETAVRKWISENKEVVDEAIKAGIVLHGLKFRKETMFAAY